MSAERPVNDRGWPEVAGKCPLCGGSLFLAADNHVTCSFVGCPDPCAVDDLLHGERTLAPVAAVRADQQEPQPDVVAMCVDGLPHQYDEDGICSVCDEDFGDEIRQLRDALAAAAPSGADQKDADDAASGVSSEQGSGGALTGSREAESAPDPEGADQQEPDAAKWYCAMVRDHAAPCSPLAPCTRWCHYLAVAAAPSTPGAPEGPDERHRCEFVADYETNPWRCERRAGHDGEHRSAPMQPATFEDAILRDPPLPVPDMPNGLDQAEGFAVAIRDALAAGPWTEPDALRAWLIDKGFPSFPWPALPPAVQGAPGPTDERVTCPDCKGHPKQPSVRIEGGSRSCRHCNRTLTFNMMRDDGGDCSCEAARREACPLCLGEATVPASDPYPTGAPGGES